MPPQKTYLAIDLKSFFASVECVERGLDPLATNLVVADHSRTEKTICLAVSPSLKAYGISGRARLFEVVQRVSEVNAARRRNAPGGALSGQSCDAHTLRTSPDLAVDYIIAPPRMSKYIEYSTRVYGTYLKYIAPEDIHVYSIDEVMMDVTGYLETYHQTAHELAMTIILDVLRETGITATAGIGTNLYLCKVAMDIGAKHTVPDENGVRIAELDEIRYRRLLWSHRPLTDFWRVGRGTAKKLEANGLYTMGDVARCSLGRPDAYHNEALLYRLFGVNAELLIDHAWGWEPVGLADIKSYLPETNSLCSGQVLQCPYSHEKARLIVREMAESLSFDLLDKGLATDQIVLAVGYDIENVSRKSFRGETDTDPYGRRIPKHALGTQNLSRQTVSARQITDAALQIYDRCVNPGWTIRRLTITANRLVPADADTACTAEPVQLNLFEAEPASASSVPDTAARERRVQDAMLQIKRKFGKNAILNGSSYETGATARMRNGQIGGHKA